MNPGDIINIYNDPLNMELFEGRAKLIRLEQDYCDIQEWIVEFIDSPGNYYPRLIKT